MVMYPTFNPSGVSTRRSTYTGTNFGSVVRRKRATGGFSTFRKKVKNLEPAKHSTISSITSCTHNDIYTHNLTQQITRGTGDENRIGDTIYLSAVKFRISYQAPTTSGAYTFRVIVGYSGEEYSTGSGFSVSQLTQAELFQTNTAGSWTPNGIINPKAFSSLYDETIDMNSMTEDTAEVRTLAFTVKLEKQFPYQSSANGFGKFKNLYCVLIASKQGGVADVTGTVVTAYDLIFK